MDNSTPPPLLVDSRTAAKMLSLGERTLWDLAAKGEIKRQKIGRLVRFAVSELERYAQAGGAK